MRLKNEDKILPRLRAGKPIAQIARDLGISKQALYKNLATLEKYGKIRRVAPGKYEVLDEKPDGNVKTETAPKSKPKPERPGKRGLPGHIRWRIKRCEELLGRKRTLPREDPVRELIHLGALRIRRDRYEVQTKELPALLYNFAAGFTNELLRMRGKQFRLPQVPKDEVVFVYCTDFTGGVWKPKDLAKLAKWENPDTKRLLRAYVRFLRKQYGATSKPA